MSRRFFQTPSKMLNRGVAAASRVGCDTAPTASSALTNWKGFSVQSVSAAYIRRTEPGSGQGSRESSCRSGSPPSPRFVYMLTWETHRFMWLIQCIFLFYLLQFSCHFSLTSLPYGENCKRRSETGDGAVYKSSYKFSLFLFPFMCFLLLTLLFLFNFFAHPVPNCWALDI